MHFNVLIYRERRAQTVNAAAAVDPNDGNCDSVVLRGTRDSRSRSFMDDNVANGVIANNGNSNDNPSSFNKDSGIDGRSKVLQNIQSHFQKLKKLYTSTLFDSKCLIFGSSPPSLADGKGISIICRY